MATRKQFTQSERERRMRNFSKDFKQKIVREIEQKKLSASDVCAEYEVSITSVNNWLRQFGQSKDKSVRVVVETESDTRKLLELKRRVAELERINRSEADTNRFQRQAYRTGRGGIWHRH
jgi:transposase-like protein